MSTAEGKFYIKDGERQIHYKDFILEILKTTRSATDNLYLDDFCFVYPFINQALALLAGIECEFFQKNFLTTSILTRSLIDCIMSLVYVTQVSTDDYQEFLNEFYRIGELTKADGKKRKRLTGNDLTKMFRKSTGVDFSNSYNQLSKAVHSTIFHMNANTKLKPGTNNMVEVAIVGEKLEYPHHLYGELRVIVEVCINTIERVLKSQCIQHETGDSHEYL